jgi:hypothetical protein
MLSHLQYGKEIPFFFLFYETQDHKKRRKEQ